MAEAPAYAYAREADLEPKNRLVRLEPTPIAGKPRSSVAAEFDHTVRQDAEEIRRGERVAVHDGTRFIILRRCWIGL
jgi:hypothetical protein